MPIWAKIDADMPTDGKLLGQPVSTRHLWTCLICLARKQDDHGAIKGFDCSVMAGAFNLSRKAVAEGLTHFQKVRMIELDPDGTIRLLNFTRWQGELTLAERRKAWSGRQDRLRGAGSVTRDNGGLSRVTAPNNPKTSHANVTRLEVEVEEEVKLEAKAKDLPPSPAAPAGPSLEELSRGWPPELLGKIHTALRSTRTSGSMADGPWRGFLQRASQFAPEIRIWAGNEYLDRAYATEKKSEGYLIAMMRGEHGRRGAARVGPATLQISPKLAEQTTGRKLL